MRPIACRSMRRANRFASIRRFTAVSAITIRRTNIAVDINMPEGTPVLAARDGVVMTVDNDFFGNGLDMAQYGDRANNIRIVHADGAMSVYAHLQLESARVQVGQHVKAGQVIALSGDTGYASGPHLHFCVQMNRTCSSSRCRSSSPMSSGAFTPQQGQMLGGR